MVGSHYKPPLVPAAFHTILSIKQAPGPELPPPKPPSCGQFWPTDRQFNLTFQGVSLAFGVEKCIWSALAEEDEGVLGWLRSDLWKESHAITRLSFLSSVTAPDIYHQHYGECSFHLSSDSEAFTFWGT